MKELTPEQHKQRHIELHQALDELVADWIAHDKGLPSKNTVLDLMKWSHLQMLRPAPLKGFLEG